MAFQNIDDEESNGQFEEFREVEMTPEDSPGGTRSWRKKPLWADPGNCRRCDPGWLAGIRPVLLPAATANDRPTGSKSLAGECNQHCHCVERHPDRAGCYSTADSRCAAHCNQGTHQYPGKVAPTSTLRPSSTPVLLPVAQTQTVVAFRPRQLPPSPRRRPAFPPARHCPRAVLPRMWACPECWQWLPC